MNRGALRVIGGLVCLVGCLVGGAPSWAQSGLYPFDRLVVQLKQEMGEIQTKSSGDPIARRDLDQLRHTLPTLAPEFPLPTTRTVATVDAYRRYGLTRYYTVDVSTLSVAQAEALLNKVKANPLVEEAYLKVPPHEIDDDAVPITQLTRANPPDYTPKQSYLYAPSAIAPGYRIGGVNAEEAWRHPGGDGSRARIVSVETSHWEFGHVDLPDPFIKHWNEGAHAVGDHDTKSVGTMVSKNNGFGTTGIAYGAAIGYSKYGGGMQLLDLANLLRSGDVIQIGIHYQINGLDPIFGCKATCFVPVDYYPDVVSAIRYLTHERGIHVIEAAANGNINLDDPYFQGRFDRSRNDSGAIMVGAADPKTGRRASYSDYGSRVDVYSWGWNVTTTSYDRWNPKQGYTDSYSGTSSANPIVAATAAVMQSVARTEGIGNVPPGVMRRILAETGTPLPNGDRSIGTQPDLVAGINTMLDEYGGGSPAPQARITGPVTVQAGSKLMLSGADSSGRDLTYEWRAEGFSPATATTHDVELTAPSNAGVREISLAVKDAAGRTHTATHRVTVDATTEPITATLTVPAQVRSGEPVPVY
ncbi:S8 family serine peptidase, partial [Burkholderia sp. AW49-1]